MSERQQYYKEFIAYQVQKYYEAEIHLTKDTESPLPNVRIDMLFEIPKKKLKKAKESPFPYLAELNLVHIKGINDRLSEEDLLQYLGQLYILGASSKGQNKSIALTILSADKLLKPVIESLRFPLLVKQMPWIYEIQAELPAYIFVLESLPESEEYWTFLPFQPLPVLEAAAAKVRRIVKESPESKDKSLFVYWLKKLQPDFYEKEIGMPIDTEEMARDVFPITLQRKKEEGIRESIIEVLQVRFNTVPEDIKERLNAILTSDVLKIHLKHAATAKTLEDFQSLL